MTLTNNGATVSGGKMCTLKVFTTGKKDIVSWYRLWEATTAVFSMCAVTGKGGSFRELGKQLATVLERTSLTVPCQEMKVTSSCL